MGVFLKSHKKFGTSTGYRYHIDIYIYKYKCKSYLKRERERERERTTDKTTDKKRLTTTDFFYPDQYQIPVTSGNLETPPWVSDKNRNGVYLSRVSRPD